MKKLRVFHGLVNYGTQAGLIAKSLREQGICALSVSFQDVYKRTIDIELHSGGIFIERSFKHIWNFARRIFWFFTYNTFHFYFGITLFPGQWDLPLYKVFGKKVVMEYLGYDVQLYQYSIDKYEITNVCFYKTRDISINHDKAKIARLKSESRYLDKQIVCAPYLAEFVPHAIVVPLAINLKDYEYSPKKSPEDEFVIMHAPTSRGNKGTQFIIGAINKLLEEGYNIKLMLVEGVSHRELINNYLECDIFIDQILAGWYGTAAIEAMALGRPTVCFIRESYFEYINYGHLIPIINAQPATLNDVLRQVIEKKSMLPEIGLKSRQFVEKIHDVKIISDKLIEIYKNL